VPRLPQQAGAEHPLTEIIRLGKQHGVDELEITMAQEAGIAFKAPIPDISIELNVGTSGTMTVKVKYKT
jgi:hypothetical protein